MKKQQYLFFYFLTLPLFLIAQKVQNQEKSVYFSPASAILNDADKGELLGLVTQIQGVSSYEIQIKAYTDTDGDKAYNQKLAQERAQSVSQFLQTNGIDLTYTSTQSLGEAGAKREKDDNDKAKNRRVDIAVKMLDFSSLKEFLEASGQNQIQKFVINNSEDTTIVASKGTTFYIPNNAFLLENGTKPQGKITINITESYDYNDMIITGLHTFSGAKMLETGGMIQIEANSEGKKLNLNEGSQIDILMPTNKQKAKNDMEVFYGNTTANGTIDWVATKTKIKIDEPNNDIKLDKNPLKKVKLEKALLKSKIVNKAAEKILIEEPTPPSKPTTPVFSSKEPRKPTILSKDKGILSSKDLKSYEQAELDYAQRLEYYNKLKEKYEKRSAKYQLDLKNYENVALPNYKIALKKIDEDIQVHFDKIMSEAITDLEYDAAKNVRQTYNVLLRAKKFNPGYPIVERGKDGFISQNKDIITHFRNLITQREDKLFTRFLGAFEFGQRNKEEMHHTIVQFYQKASFDCKRFLSPEQVALYNISPQLPYSYYHLLFLESQRQASLGAYSLLDAAKEMQKECEGIVKEREKDKAKADFANGNAAQVMQYAFSTTQLGWINCDRFYNVSENNKMLVQLAAPTTSKIDNDERVFMVFENIKSLMYMISEGNGKYKSAGSVPIGEKITLVGLRFEGGKAALSVQSTTTDKADYAQLNLNYQKVSSLQELNEKLKKWL